MVVTLWTWKTFCYRWWLLSKLENTFCYRWWLLSGLGNFSHIVLVYPLNMRILDAIGGGYSLDLRILDAIGGDYSLNLIILDAIGGSYPLDLENFLI